MTSRQRMLAAIHHQPVDRVPVAPWGLGRIDMESALGRELLGKTDPWIEVGLGCSPVFGAQVMPRTERVGQVERRTLTLGERELVSEWTTTAQTTACTQYYCKSMADVEALLALPYARPAPNVDAFRALQSRIGEDGLAVMSVADGLCFPNDMLGTEYCSLLWASEPDTIRALVRMAAERTYDVVEQACRQGVDCFRIVGGEYATQLMGQAAWDELIVPFDGPLVEMIHDHGALAHYHNHGNMQRFLEQIADLGIDSLDPIEQPPYGDIEMDQAAERIGERVCLVGGLDDMEVLETRPTDEVRRLGAELVRRVDSPGFMLGGTSSGIYGQAAARNFIALAEMVAAIG